MRLCTTYFVPGVAAHIRLHLQALYQKTDFHPQYFQNLWPWTLPCKFVEVLPRQFQVAQEDLNQKESCTVGIQHSLVRNRNMYGLKHILLISKQVKNLYKRTSIRWWQMGYLQWMVNTHTIRKRTKHITESGNHASKPFRVFDNEHNRNMNHSVS